MYRFEARIIGRSQGKSATKAAAHNTGKRNSAVKAAAYLSRSELTDAKGQTWDYSDHFGGAGSVLLLPDGAPKEFRDREALWRSVEKVENRKDSMLARDPIITMPWELTQKEMWAAITKYARQEFVSQGKPVDIGLHIYGEPWKASADATSDKVAEWKEKDFAFYEQGQVPEDCTGPHVLMVRDDQGQIDRYYLYQPHMHLMTTFRSIDPDSPTGWAKHKDTVTDGHWAVHERDYLEHLKKTWAEIGADALLAKGLTVEADRFRVGYLKNDQQREAALARGDLEWAEQLDRKPEPKKGPIGAKKEREDQGHESKSFLEWLKVTTENQIRFIDNQRKKLMDAEELSTGRLQENREQAIKDIIANKDSAKEQYDDLRRQFAADKAEADRREKELAENRAARAKIDDIDDVKERALRSARLFDGSDESMLRVIGAEHDDYRASQDRLKEQIAEEKDPAKKHLLELRHDIQHAEYAEYVHQKLAGYSWSITGDRGMIQNPEYGLVDDPNAPTNQPIKSGHQIEVDAAKYWGAKADALREEYAEHLQAMREPAANQQQDQKGPIYQPGVHVRANMTTGEKEVVNDPGADKAADYDNRRIDPTSDYTINRDYDRYVAQSGGVWSEEGRKEYAREVRELWEEYRQAGVEAAIERGDIGIRASPHYDESQYSPDKPAETRPLSPSEKHEAQWQEFKESVTWVNLRPDQQERMQENHDKRQAEYVAQEAGKSSIERGPAYDQAMAGPSF